MQKKKPSVSYCAMPKHNTFNSSSLLNVKAVKKWIYIKSFHSTLVLLSHFTIVVLFCQMKLACKPRPNIKLTSALNTFIPICLSDWRNLLNTTQQVTGVLCYNLSASPSVVWVFLFSESPLKSLHRIS